MKHLNSLLQAYCLTEDIALLPYVFQYTLESNPHEYDVCTVYGAQRHIDSAKRYFPWLMSSVVRNFSAHKPDAFIYNLEFQRGFKVLTVRDDNKVDQINMYDVGCSFIRYAVEVDPSRLSLCFEFAYKLWKYWYGEVKASPKVTKNIARLMTEIMHVDNKTRNEIITDYTDFFKNNSDIILRVLASMLRTGQESLEVQKVAGILMWQIHAILQKEG